MAYVQRLPDTSLTAALMRGGREHFGWGVDRYMQADVFDAININTKVTGHWKKGKAPDFPAWPRPETAKANRKDEPKPKVTLAEIHRKLTRR